MTKQHLGAFSLAFSLVVIMALMLSAPVSAQQQQQPPDKSVNPSTTVEKSESDQGKQVNPKTGTTDDRLFGVLPNYLTVENAHEIPVLTTGEKYKLAAKSSFDPADFAFVGFVALVAQAEDTDPSWGQGAAGYGRRYGSAFADSTIGTFMTSAIFPSLLRQDPRYYQLGKGSFTHRTYYSVSRIFVTRADSGRKQFNYSEIAGNAVAAGIGNAYSPSQERTLQDTMTKWGTQIMWDTVANVAKEFWPDIRRKIRKDN